MKALTSRSGRRRRNPTIYEVARRAGVSIATVSRVHRDAHLVTPETRAISGLAFSRYRLRHRRLDRTHSTLVATWGELGGMADWPDGGQWAELAARDRLEELQPERIVETAGGSIELAFGLPMPSVSLVELVPA